MNNENFENVKKDEKDEKTEEAKIIESLKKRINYLEEELINTDDNFKEHQKNTESIKKELHETQVALSQIEEILDKLKINEAGTYNLSAADFKDLKNLLYEVKN